MRISDWSSDVCSSDLLRGVRKLTREAGAKQAASARGHRDRDDVAIHPGAPIGRIADQEMDRQRLAAQPAIRRPGYRAHARQIDRVTADRKRPEEHTSELQSLMRTPYAVFSLHKK